jgi:predicted permease
MGDIIQSICAIALIMAVGWIARRSGALGPHASHVLSDFVYWIASPALLFSTISTTDVAAVLGAPLAVAAASGAGTAMTFWLIAGPLLRADRPNVILGAMSSSLNNAAYIGIPIAVYVLGSASHGVPIMVFQLGFFTPMFFVLADLAGSGRRPTAWGIARSVATNPMVIAAVLGFVCAFFHLPVPRLLAIATEMTGQSAPPVVLIAFGASLVGQFFAIRSRLGHLVAIASVFKLVLEPALACLVGALLGLRGVDLMAVTVMGGLPTAQNAFVASSRAHAGEEIAQGTVLITTLASLPMTLLTAWVFHAVIGV